MEEKMGVKKMYKDVLELLKRDRRVDEGFIKRLEKNGFNVYYDKFDYWDGQPYVEIGEEKVWLVEIQYTPTRSCGVCYRKRNSVCLEIKETIEQEKKRVIKEEEIINEVLPKK